MDKVICSQGAGSTLEEVKKNSYGKRSENGTWIPSVDLCTEEIAEGLLSKARHSLQATEKFFEEVKRGFI